jgi:NAD(P)-dependent dehydrogenase (short-subunit alcohol dehydrogenase family)
MEHSMEQFKGKVAVVTGAGSGIGRALALQLADQGCLLALSDISVEGLAQTEALLPADCKVMSVQLDVANRQAIKDYALATVAHYGAVDIVINNAGVGLIGDVLDISDEDFDWLMDINFWGMVNGSRAFLPHLEQRPQAWLVNLSSIFGVIGVPGQAAYNASKFGVRGFTEALWHEYRDTSVTVCCVYPGGIKTNIARASRASRSVTEDRHSEGAARFDELARTTPEQAASIILQGMAKKQNRILIGKDARLISLLARLFPQSYGRLIARIFDMKV